MTITITLHWWYLLVAAGVLALLPLFLGLMLLFNPTWFWSR